MDDDVPVDEIRKLAGFYGERLEYQFDLMDSDIEYNLEIVTDILDDLREKCGPLVHAFYLRMYNEVRPTNTKELL